MTLNTVAASGRADVLANTKTRYWTVNLLTGERVSLVQASDGAFADHPMSRRIGHQVQDTDGASIAPTGQTGIATWKLGTRDSFVTLSAADCAVIYVPVNAFGSAGVLSAPVVTALASEPTRVQQDSRVTSPAPPRGNGQAIAQLAIIQGGNVVLLSQQNCADLAPQLNTIGGT